MLFAVNLSAPAAQTITVDYATAVGGANPATAGTCGNAGVDYQPTSGTLTFNIGDQIKTIPVTICADAANETDETLLLNLTNYSNLARAQATGTILASSLPGTVLISELRTSGPAGAGDDFVEFTTTLIRHLLLPPQTHQPVMASTRWVLIAMLRRY